MSNAGATVTMSTSCHTDRRRDKMYTMLANDMDAEMVKMLKAVRKLVKGHSTHPDVDYVFSRAEKEPCVARAIILYAIANESEFASYMLERPDVDAACVSEFIYKTVTPFAEELMNGRMSLEYFVNSCLVEYTTM